VPKIKVLPGTMPPMMRGLLTWMIRAQTDMEVVAGRALGPLGLAEAIGQTGATFVIEALPDPGQMPAAYLRIFDLYPEIAILVLPLEGEEAVLYQRTVTRRRVAAAPVECIPELIRARGEEDIPHP
jgi:hypothetical protein